ncbi:cupin domain-containing protein [Desulfosalsimonas sp.]|uniref:cupin domain-containing protein n=1 Tax=Desulfosalsimonas sp. TaxID=3073848 RepID=UPI003970D868
MKIERIQAELISAYPGCHVRITEDKQEIYHVLRGELYVDCGGRGCFVREGESLCIEPGLIHYARTVSEPAWVEVESAPPWLSEDHISCKGMIYLKSGRLSIASSHE